MIRFTVDGKRHEFDDDRLTLGEGRAMEKATGSTVQEIQELAKRGSLTAIQAFIWVAMKRSDPPLRFSDLDDRALADFEFEDPDDEPEGEQDPTGVAAEIEPSDSTTGD